MYMYLFTVDTSRTSITKHTMPKNPGRSRKITSSVAEYLGRLSVYDVPCTVLIFVRTCARILTFPLYLSGLLIILLSLGMVAPTVTKHYSHITAEGSSNLSQFRSLATLIHCLRCIIDVASTSVKDKFADSYVELLSRQVTAGVIGYSAELSKSILNPQP